ncbi:MAG: PTS sugar transporter subunit IIA [Candidatus Pacebacteria bacterium]|nr:PTS sugar transporter subunit IIA [Candidatus Paceibacterota bacterium]
MDIKSLIPASHVLLGLKGETPRDILRNLSKPLAMDNILSDAEAFLDDVERREGQFTTQVDNTVALPHARSNTVRRLACSVGIASDPGLAFNPTENNRCRLFFMLAVPAFAPTAHLPLLQHLANFAHDPERVEKLLDSTTPAKAARQIVRFRG